MSGDDAATQFSPQSTRFVVAGDRATPQRISQNRPRTSDVLNSHGDLLLQSILRPLDSIQSPKVFLRLLQVLQTLKPIDLLLHSHKFVLQLLLLHDVLRKSVN
jgi:hypothetical protein